MDKFTYKYQLVDTQTINRYSLLTYNNGVFEYWRSDTGDPAEEFTLGRGYLMQPNEDTQPWHITSYGYV